MSKRGPIIRRTDGNQHGILKKCRSIGIGTQSIHIVGHGCPDALLGYRGITKVVEIKMPGEKLTDDEITWHETWPGQVDIVHTLEEVLALFGIVCS